MTIMTKNKILSEHLRKKSNSIFILTFHYSSDDLLKELEEDYGETKKEKGEHEEAIDPLDNSSRVY